MPYRTHSEAIRLRFVEAVEHLAAAGYPKETVVSIVRSVGMEPSNYYGLRKPGRYPTLDNCAELCLRHDISPAWLFLGEGTMKKVDVKTMNALELLKQSVQAIETELKEKTKPVAHS